MNKIACGCSFLVIMTLSPTSSRALVQVPSGAKGFLVLLRHGESEWNRAERYIGWADPPLTSLGEEEARAAGRTLKDWPLDCVHTSLLKRAIKTSWLATGEMNAEYLPETRSALLNERFVGDLIGRTSAEATAIHGKENLTRWRRSYNIPPAPVSRLDQRHPVNDRRYASYEEMVGFALPSTESMVEVESRARFFWERTLLPQISSGKRVMCVAHANILKALMKVIDGLPPTPEVQDAIISIGIPRATPIVFSFNENMESLWGETAEEKSLPRLKPFSGVLQPGVALPRKGGDEVNAY